MHEWLAAAADCRPLLLAVTALWAGLAADAHRSEAASGRSIVRYARVGR